jgi:hypothetical protein
MLPWILFVLPLVVCADLKDIAWRRSVTFDYAWRHQVTNLAAHHSYLLLLLEALNTSPCLLCFTI